MTLKQFQEELEKECKLSFKDLKDGSRIEKMEKRTINSMTDVVLNRKKIQPFHLHRSCIITFGNVLEKVTMQYAKLMGKTTYLKKNFLSAKIDIVFRIGKRVYNLESKCNIELDAGKSKKALETLKRKGKMVFQGLDCEYYNWVVVSKFVVWTKGTSKDAAKTAKKPIEEIHLMGFKDFFKLFSIEIETEEFFRMLRMVYEKEVVRYFPK